jgi:hypothetical protein
MKGIRSLHTTSRRSSGGQSEIVGKADNIFQSLLKSMIRPLVSIQSRKAGGLVVLEDDSVQESMLKNEKSTCTNGTDSP